MHANPLLAKGEFLHLLLINDVLNLMSFITQCVDGTPPNGECVKRYDLDNLKGVFISITTFGGIFTSIKNKLGQAAVGVKMQFFSCDNNQGYPGNLPVDNSPFDFRASKAIGEEVHQEDQQLKLAQGYANFILDQPNNGLFEFAAKVYDPASGRRCRAYTEEPYLQFYSGKLLDNPRNRDSSNYPKWSGLCHEAEHFPATPNNPHFPSTLLHPRKIFSSCMSYQFDTL